MGIFIKRLFCGAASICTPLGGSFHFLYFPSLSSDWHCPVQLFLPILALFALLNIAKGRKAFACAKVLELPRKSAKEARIFADLRSAPLSPSRRGAIGRLRTFFRQARFYLPHPQPALALLHAGFFLEKKAKKSLASRFVMSRIFMYLERKRDRLQCPISICNRGRFLKNFAW